jgi:16S rRNA (guanine(527)-N(7))-methyltransferase RsmG
MVTAQDQDIERAWQDLQNEVSLSPEQLDQLKRYYLLLISWNEQMNLTTITEPRQMIAYHLHDSLRVGDFMDMNSIHVLADVGTGGGFPGIPLKVRYPHLTVYLLEVNHKKVRFLATVIKELGLTDVHLIDLDWRTFLRKTALPIDLFCARASLAPEELLRMFKPACPYNNALLIYWASTTWQASKAVVPQVKNEIPYEVGNKKRKFVFLGTTTVTTK